MLLAAVGMSVVVARVVAARVWEAVVAAEAAPPVGVAAVAPAWAAVVVGTPAEAVAVAAAEVVAVDRTTKI